MRGAITLHDKQFRPFLSHEQIVRRVAELAERIAADFEGKRPVLLGVLNGCYRFLADLSQHLDMACEIDFIRVRSYSGTHSSGAVKQLFALSESIAGRHVIIVEDIVDTGRTLEYLCEELRQYDPDTVSVASLLLKPDVFKMRQTLHYVGFEIPDLFVVGYGLDYDGLGRNLNDIYQIAEQT